MNLNSLSSYTLSIVTVIGLIVLIALHDLTVAQGLSPILLISGVHIGVAVSNTPVQVDTTVTKVPPIQ